MIRLIRNSNLFESKADALVNPVNCRGSMGKGIALVFRRKYPEIMLPYKRACEKKILRPGKLLFVPLKKQKELFHHILKGIILFPTKDHWRNPSQLRWIKAGLINLKRNYKKWDLKSIGMPQIGCGLGGLKWSEVFPLIEEYFRDASLIVEVYIYAAKRYGEK